MKLRVWRAQSYHPIHPPLQPPRHPALNPMTTTIQTSSPPLTAHPPTSPPPLLQLTATRRRASTTPMQVSAPPGCHCSASVSPSQWRRAERENSRALCCLCPVDAESAAAVEERAVARGSSALPSVSSGVLPPSSSSRAASSFSSASSSPTAARPRSKYAPPGFQPMDFETRRSARSHAAVSYKEKVTARHNHATTRVQWSRAAQSVEHPPLRPATLVPRSVQLLTARLCAVRMSGGV